MLSKGRYRAYMQQAIDEATTKAMGIPKPVVAIQYEFDCLGFGLISPRNMRVCVILQSGEEFDITRTMTKRNKLGFPREMASMINDFPEMTVVKI